MITSYLNREAWLAARSNSIGASEAGAALGLSPWESPFSLWCRKTGRVPEKDLGSVEVVDWGVRLEEPIVQAFGDRTLRRVEWNDSHTVATHDEYAFLTATLDAIQFCRADEDLPEGPGSLEIKTTSHWNAKGWEDGRPPEYMRCQLQQQLLCAGLEWGSIAVLVGGQRLIVHTERFNQAFWDAALPRLQEFWRCVENGEQPAIDNSKATAEAIAAMFPMDNGTVAELPGDAIAWCDELQTVKNQIKELSARKAGLENQIKAALGSAEVGVAAGYVVKYPTIERAGYTVEPSSYRRLTIKQEN